CHPQIQAIIDEVWQKEKEKAMIESANKPVKKLTNIRKMQLIQETIERDIRPALQSDGGDIELIDIGGGGVMVCFRGSFVESPHLKVTLKFTVEAKLQEFVANTIIVE